MNRHLMILLALGIAALAILGCATAPEAHAKDTMPSRIDDQPSTNGAGQGSPSPSDGQDGEVAQSGGQTKTEQPAVQGKQDEYPHVQNRVYQLKDLERTTCKIDGKHKFNVWIMDSNGKRMEGMMRLKDEHVKSTDGMVFVFPDSDYRGFWMKNTLIPLDIAYVNEHFKIVNVATMKALDENTTPSTGPAMYVLEFKAGTFKKLGIKAGMKVEFGKKLESID